MRLPRTRWLIARIAILIGAWLAMGLPLHMMRDMNVDPELVGYFKGGATMLLALWFVGAFSKGPAA